MTKHNPESLLRQIGLRVTPIRLNLLHLLQNSDRPVSVPVLKNQLAKYCDLWPNKTTLYRELETLHRAGLVQSLTLLDGVIRFEYSTTAHPHLACRLCQELICVQAQDSWIQSTQALAGGYDFGAEANSALIYGLCHKCRQ